MDPARPRLLELPAVRHEARSEPAAQPFPTSWPVPLLRWQDRPARRGRRVVEPEAACPATHPDQMSSRNVLHAPAPRMAIARRRPLARGWTIDTLIAADSRPHENGP